jgi:hypothetical protein
LLIIEGKIKSGDTVGVEFKGGKITIS